MKKVLVVDDTKNIRLTLTKCLEIDGYQVQTAANGREGYEAICTGKFDLIFLDIKLPELSGTEVLRKIRARGIGTPVIIITAYPTVKNAVECTQLGTMAYLQKPFTADRLRSVLEGLSLDAQRRSGLREEVGRLLKDGDGQTALGKLKSALAQSPADPQIYQLLADAYEQLGDPQTAEKFRRAAEVFDT